MTLPSVVDAETLYGERHVWVRRVSRRNLWVLYDLRPNEVWLVGLLDAPPIPVG